MQKQRPPVRKPLLLISGHFFLQMGQAFKRLIERLVLLGKVDADDVIQTNILRKLRGILKAADYDQLIVGGFQFEQVITSQQMAMGRQGNLPDNVPGPGAVVWRSLIRRSFLSAHRVNFRHP